MPEFDYKQRKTTDSYRKGWEKVFSGKKHTFTGKAIAISGAGIDDNGRYYIIHADGRKEYAETTEQKQPYLNN